MILVLGKARSHRAPNLGCRGPESPGRFDVLPKPLQETWCMSGRIVVMKLQSPFACSCSLLNHLNSFVEECSSLTQNLMQVRGSTCSVTLNVTATQYTCSLNGFYHPHCLIQWSCHCSHMCIPIHTPWLPGFIEVVQTILVILTMAGLFPDRPCT